MVATANVLVEYSIVRIKIRNRKRAGDISGRVDTGIWHEIFRKYGFLYSPPLNGQITQRFFSVLT